ncbi:MAG: type III pantothenate kinase [Bacteroidia bacterium]|nr:type III pantothenate kinase [Bacteroidia bacterium]
MNLVADVGNTRVKIALFEGDVLKYHYFFSLEETDAISAFIKVQTPNRAIVSSVVNNGGEIINGLKSAGFSVVEYTSKTMIPVKNLYKTPDTLGNDRIPPVIAAQKQQPGSAILVIDAGTCIKYNFLNKQAEYLGGAISPGLNMRFKALHTFTSRLPLIEPDAAFNRLIGTDSRESILAGVQTAAAAEVNAMIDQYVQQFPGVNVFLTGGDMAFFEKRIKNPIFADPNLVLKGLNIILNYNA